MYNNVTGYSLSIYTFNVSDISDGLEHKHNSGIDNNQGYSVKANKCDTIEYIQ